MDYEVVLIDTTEKSVQRQKKTKGWSKVKRKDIHIEKGIQT